MQRAIGIEIQPARGVQRFALNRPDRRRGATPWCARPERGTRGSVALPASLPGESFPSRDPARSLGPGPFGRGLPGPPCGYPGGVTLCSRLRPEVSAEDGADAAGVAAAGELDVELCPGLVGVGGWLAVAEGQLAGCGGVGVHATSVGSRDPRGQSRAPCLIVAVSTHRRRPAPRCSAASGACTTGDRRMPNAQVTVADYTPNWWPAATRLLIRRVVLDPGTGQNTAQITTDPRIRRRRTLHPEQRTLPLPELAALDVVYGYSFIGHQHRRHHYSTGRGSGVLVPPPHPDREPVPRHQTRRRAAPPALSYFEFSR